MEDFRKDFNAIAYAKRKYNTAWRALRRLCRQKHSPVSGLKESPQFRTYEVCRNRYREELFSRYDSLSVFQGYLGKEIVALGSKPVRQPEWRRGMVGYHLPGHLLGGSPLADQDDNRPGTFQGGYHPEPLELKVQEEHAPPLRRGPRVTLGQHVVEFDTQAIAALAEQLSLYRREYPERPVLKDRIPGMILGISVVILMLLIVVFWVTSSRAWASYAGLGAATATVASLPLAVLSDSIRDTRFPFLEWFLYSVWVLLLTGPTALSVGFVSYGLAVNDREVCDVIAISGVLACAVAIIAISGPFLEWISRKYNENNWLKYLAWLLAMPAIVILLPGAINIILMNAAWNWVSGFVGYLVNRRWLFVA